MFCSKCGGEAKNDAKICEKCGNAFSQEKNASEAVLPNGLKIPQPTGEKTTANVSADSGNLSVKETIGYLFFVIVVVVAIAMSKLDDSTGSTQPSQNDVVLNAEQIIMENLKSPSSYSRQSAAIVWTGKDQKGHDAYVARVEYDAQNGFGALIRNCQFVAFIVDNGKTMYRQKGAIDNCSGGGIFSEQQMIEVLVNGNFI